MAGIIFQCKSDIDKSELPAYTAKELVNAIIEIPAGTNKKIEYNKTTKKFEIDQRDGKDRVINFLPYPGNYGYIPGTFSDPKQGGDGDGLDILVISEAIPTGTVLETIPLGMLKLIDAGEYDYKIIAIPSTTALRTVTASNFQELQAQYPGLLAIVENWFLNYDPKDRPISKGWADEIAAQEEINKSLK